MDSELKTLIARAESVLARVEALFPPVEPDPDWKKITAARWRKRSGRGYLQGVAHPHAIALSDLVAIDAQKQTIDRNTRQFVAGLPANNVLLTGSRGTGKSSLVKAMLARYHGMPYDRIADTLGIEVGAVKVRVHRAMKQLRAAFFRLEDAPCAVKK